MGINPSFFPVLVMINDLTSFATHFILARTRNVMARVPVLSFAKWIRELILKLTEDWIVRRYAIMSPMEAIFCDHHKSTRGVY